VCGSSKSNMSNSSALNSSAILASPPFRESTKGEDGTREQRGDGNNGGQPEGNQGEVKATGVNETRGRDKEGPNSSKEEAISGYGKSLGLGEASSVGTVGVGGGREGSEEGGEESGAEGGVGGDTSQDPSRKSIEGDDGNDMAREIILKARMNPILDKCNQELND